jgi:signal transduction histidine kinase
MRLIKRLEYSSRELRIAITLGIVGVVAVVDYAIGFQLSLAIFYLLAVLISIWFVGRGFAILISVLSVSVSLAGDIATGALHSGSLIPWWNALIVLSFYLAFIPLVTSLRSLQRELEEKSLALTKEERALKLLSGRLISAQEDERQRISRDLHDDLGQILTSVSLDLQRVLLTEDPKKERNLLGRALESNREAATRVREISSLLRPPILDDVGLKEALQTFLSEFSSRNGIKTNLHFGHDGVLPNEVRISIYRIVLEALNNVSKYAHASTVHVELFSDEAETTLMIRDNGVGFDPSSNRIEKGLGLAGMKERSELLGGSFFLSSTPQNGTLIRVKLPLQKDTRSMAGDRA